VHKIIVPASKFRIREGTIENGIWDLQALDRFTVFTERIIIYKKFNWDHELGKPETSKSSSIYSRLQKKFAPRNLGNSISHLFTCFSPYRKNCSPDWYTFWKGKRPMQLASSLSHGRPKRVRGRPQTLDGEVVGLQALLLVPKPITYPARLTGVPSMNKTYPTPYLLCDWKWIFLYIITVRAGMTGIARAINTHGLHREHDTPTVFVDLYCILNHQKFLVPVYVHRIIVKFTAFTNPGEPHWG
jgi:hypothetical protein